jgi:hypothetical protein
MVAQMSYSLCQFWAYGERKEIVGSGEYCVVDPCEDVLVLPFSSVLYFFLDARVRVRGA